jgi:hypothetical protein
VSSRTFTLTVAYDDSVFVVSFGEQIDRETYRLE